MRNHRCLFCGEVMRGPDHLKFCDGKQGSREAAIAAAEPAILDPVEATIRTEAGIAQSRAHAPAEWKAAMVGIVIRVAEHTARFTADDVWVAAGRIGYRANRSALGPVLRDVARQGVIELTTERQESQRPATHRRPLRVWRSLVCVKAGA